MKNVLLLILLLTNTILYAAEKKTIRTSFYRQNIAPQLFFDAVGNPTSGILFDLTHAITGNISLGLELLPIPRKRIVQALNTNVIDMHCAANPQWYKEQDFQWSDAIYSNPDILVNRHGLTSLEQLKHQDKFKVGTTLGYVYPELTTLLTNKRIVSIMSTTPYESYQKYQKGKVSAFISASVEASYFSKHAEDSVIILNENTIHCMYSSHLSKDLVKRLNDSIESLKSKGVIDDILARYQKMPQGIDTALGQNIPAE